MVVAHAAHITVLPTSIVVTAKPDCAVLTAARRKPLVTHTVLRKHGFQGRCRRGYRTGALASTMADASSSLRGLVGELLLLRQPNGSSQQCA